MKYVTPAVIIIVIISLIFYNQIAALLLVVGYTIIAGIGLLGGIALLFGSWYLRERVLLLQASRIEAQKQASVLTISDNGETWVRDTDSRATWRNLTGTPSLYVNGNPAAPQDWEMELHRLRLASTANTSAGAKVIPGQAQLLPEPDPDPLDLLAVFTQATQSYAIIGGQQTGKTFQARHIAAHWVDRHLRPVVIGPKWDKGEWDGCYLIGGNGGMAGVEWGINIVRRLVEERHASQRPHKSHPIQPIFFDDWTPIVDAVPNARALVLEATTLYASVNVLLYFILHSDTANAWGVDRKGAALKDNFVKLFIHPVYDANGLIVRNQTSGTVRFSGDSLERPVTLFTAPPEPRGRAVVITPPQPQNDQEQTILELTRQGQTKKAICDALGWTAGGKQYQKIEAVLAQQA